MTGTTVTVRPNGDAVAGIFYPVGPGSPTTLWSVLSDDDDATWAQGDTDPSSSGTDTIIDLGTVALPPLAQIRSVTPWARASSTMSDRGVSCWFGVKVPIWGSSALTLGGAGGTPTTIVGAPLTSAPGGQQWTQNLLDLLQFRFYRGIVDLAPPSLRVHEIGVDLVYNEAPTAVITGPGPTPSTAQPTITWTYSDPERDAQERWQAKAFLAETVAAPGFDPRHNVSPGEADTGEQFGADSSWVVGFPLENGRTYVPFVKVADVGSSGRYSDWIQGAAFTVTLAVAVATPAIKATVDEEHAAVVVDVLDRNNLLSNAESTMDPPSGYDWVPTLNVTALDRSATEAAHGSTASLRVTPTAAGHTIVNVPSDNYRGVAPSAVYTLMMSAKMAASTAALSVDWLNKADVHQTNQLGPAFVTRPDRFVDIYFPVRSVADAAWAVLGIDYTAVAGGELDYFDSFAIIPGYVNLLTDPEGTFELSVSLPDVQNCAVDKVDALALTGDVAPQGGRVMVMTSTIDGDMRAGTPDGLNGFSVVSGLRLTFAARFRVLTAPRTVRVWAQWYDGSGTGISATMPAGVVAYPGAWSGVSFAVDVPVGARFVQMYYQVDAALDGEQVLVDRGGIMPTPAGEIAEWVPPGGWTVGGFANAGSFIPGDNTDTDCTLVVERSLDDGLTWSTLRGGAAAAPDTFSRHAVLYDYEVPMLGEAVYRARALNTYLGDAISSALSENVAATMPGSCDGWLKDPTDPTRNLRTLILQGMATDIVTSEMVIKPVKRPTFVVIGDPDAGAAVYHLTVEFTNDADWDAFEILRKSGRALLMQTGFGDGTRPLEQAYVRLTALVNTTSVVASTRRKVAIRRVKVDAYTVKAPA